MVRGGKTGDRATARERRWDSRPDPIAAARAPVLSASLTSAEFPSELFHIPAYWQLIAGAMVAALFPAMAEAPVLPDPLAMAAFLAAVAVAALAPWFVRFERGQAGSPLQCCATAALAIGLPMLLFGAGIATWAWRQGQPFWMGAVGTTALVSAAASVLLARRPPMMFLAIASIWLLPVAVSGSREACLFYAWGSLGGLLLVVRQTQIYRTAMERRGQRERVQARALDILVDYEKTGQGWFWETDRRGAITYVSPVLGEVFDCPAEDLLGRPFTELFLLDGGHDGGEPALVFHFSARSVFQDLQVRAAIEREERWWSISGSPIHDRFGNFFGFRGFGSDQTEKHRSQERTSRLAHYDSLTGVANRFQMSQSLEKILNAQHEEHRSCAVFLIDLDRFKQVNDTLGHPAGDALLKQVAERLRRTVGAGGRVGRLGGDEFQVLLPGFHRRENLVTLAERIVEALSEPYLIEGQRAVIGASVGIALAPGDGVTSDALVRNADLALYAAKDRGRGCFHFYAPDLHSDAEERRQLEQDLREAIARGRLELWYQPVVHTRSERITGFEALLRWNHPRLGRLSPAKFIPIAEDAGLIAQIGEWALRTACRDLARWPESVRVAVNVSPLQFANPALPAIVTNALAAAQVTPSRLELEITESVFLNEESSTEAMFAALKRIGVRLALDDFGTGYSSLGYLQNAPFDKIKIDQSFMRSATIPGSRNGAILASIIGLAEALGMETTAEGIETVDELDLVRALGCSHVQGYIYEPPMTVDDTVARLAVGLTAQVSGPQSTRAPRHTVLRKVVLEHGGDRYDGVVRNISISGAMIEGVRDMAPGTTMELHVGEDQVITATARWCDEDRIGVEFAVPLMLDTLGTDPRPPRRRPAGNGKTEPVRRTG